MLNACLLLTALAVDPTAPTPAVTPLSLTVAPQDSDSLYGEAPWHTLRWSFVQFGPNMGDPDGWELLGSYEVNENVYIFGEDLFFDENGVESSLLRFGAGYHTPLDIELGGADSFKETEVYGRAGFLSLGAGAATGFELSTGVRSIIVDRVEAQVAFGYEEVSGVDASFFGSIRGEYEFTRNIAASLEFELADEEYIALGARFYL